MPKEFRSEGRQGLRAAPPPAKSPREGIYQAPARNYAEENFCVVTCGKSPAFLPPPPSEAPLSGQELPKGVARNADYGQRSTVLSVHSDRRRVVVRSGQHVLEPTVAMERCASPDACNVDCVSLLCHRSRHQSTTKTVRDCRRRACGALSEFFIDNCPVAPDLVW